MTLTALDSYGPIPGAQLRAAGITAIGRYLTLPGTPKGITPSELANLKASEVAVWLGFEIEETDVTGGYALGAQHAQWANEALAALGLPASQPVYFAVDETVEPTSTVAYFQGAASIRTPKTNGAYASGAVIARLFALDLIGYGWQSGSKGWRTNAVTLPETAIQQTEDEPTPFADTDANEICKADFGQYPRPAPPQETDDMPIGIVEYAKALYSVFATAGQIAKRHLSGAQVAALEAAGVKRLPNGKAPWTTAVVASLPVVA